MKWLWLAALVGCGSQPCQAPCDCTQAYAPIKCAGEWVCGAAKTCEYQCKSPCLPGTVFTCGSDEECNGSICSERKACQ